MFFLVSFLFIFFSVFIMFLSVFPMFVIVFPVFVSVFSLFVCVLVFVCVRETVLRSIKNDMFCFVLRPGYVN